MFTPTKLIAGCVVVLGTCGLASAQNLIFPPPPFVPQPSMPLFVTPNTPTNINPFTGGIDTSNLQINDSAFDPGRDAAMFNGTMRNVDRAIYDPFGNIVGRQQGVEWYNPTTGRWNGDLNNQTLNGMGGVNHGRLIKSQNPNAGRSSNLGGGGGSSSRPPFPNGSGFNNGGGRPVTPINNFNNFNNSRAVPRVR